MDVCSFLVHKEVYYSLSLEDGCFLIPNPILFRFLEVHDAVTRPSWEELGLVCNGGASSLTRPYAKKTKERVDDEQDKALKTAVECSRWYIMFDHNPMFCHTIQICVAVSDSPINT